MAGRGDVGGGGEWGEKFSPTPSLPWQISLVVGLPEVVILWLQWNRFFLLLQGKKVVIDDENGSCSRRQSILSIIQNKVGWKLFNR